MGIVNVTPDSFFDGGLYFDAEKAVAHGLRLLEEGADMMDIGGESTRPGATVAARLQPLSSNPDRSTSSRAPKIAVSEEEELRRVLPVIVGIKKARPDAVISVDTYKAGVARAAVAAGSGNCERRERPALGSRRWRRPSLN